MTLKEIKKQPLDDYLCLCIREVGEERFPDVTVQPRKREGKPPGGGGGGVLD